MEHRETDLADLERSLRELRLRLETISAPLNARMRALGPAGLYALAAAERTLAEDEYHHQRRRLHLDAARAAEQLGDHLAALRAVEPR